MAETDQISDTDVSAPHLPATNYNTTSEIVKNGLNKYI
jgi:hypothetical protein